MSDEIVQVATLRVRSGCMEEAMELLRPALAATHGEAGCLKYALHISQEEPPSLVMIERWVSPDAVISHRQEPHLAEVMERLPALLEGTIDVVRLDPLPGGDAVKGQV